MRESGDPVIGDLVCYFKLFHLVCYKSVAKFWPIVAFWLSFLMEGGGGLASTNHRSIDHYR